MDYTGLKKKGAPDLSVYLRSLEQVRPEEYEKWNRPQKVAFWINAYNAYTIRIVLEHFPLKSIREIGLLPGSAFREKFIPLGHLAGQTGQNRKENISLNDIEHDILRKKFQDPRIHFAIVCASRSCPKLQPEAYRPEYLERQLDSAAREFCRDPSRNRWEPDRRTLHLSSIFQWFHEDFEKASGRAEKFFARYADESAAAGIQAGDIRVEFLPYDWSLNGE